MALKRVIYVADSHGDRINKKVERDVFDFIDQWKPHMRFHLGDLFDFRALRRKANENEKMETILEDKEAGEEFLRKYRPNIWLLGNHDDRLYEIAKWGTGAVRDLAKEGVRQIGDICDSIKCTIVPFGKKDGVYSFGDMKLLHGYASGAGAVRQHASVYGKCLIGHTHAYDVASVSKYEGPSIAASIPALCILDQEYNRQMIGSLRHSNGWAYGVIDEKTGETETWIAKKVGGKWALPVIG